MPDPNGPPLAAHRVFSLRYSRVASCATACPTAEGALRLRPGATGRPCDRLSNQDSLPTLEVHHG